MVRINFGVYLYSHTKSARGNNRDVNATKRRSDLAKNIENQRTPSLSLVRLSRQPDAHSARPTQASRIYDNSVVDYDSLRLFSRYFVGVLIAFSSQIGERRLKTSSMQQFQNDQKTIYAYNNVL